MNGGGFSSSKEFPDEVLRFVRSHPVMYRPVLPQHRRPVLLQTEPGRRKLTQIAVDRVQAQDGHYHVLYIGTGIHTMKNEYLLCLVQNDRRDCLQIVLCACYFLHLGAQIHLIWHFDGIKSYIKRYASETLINQLMHTLRQF